MKLISSAFIIVTLSQFTRVNAAIPDFLPIKPNYESLFTFNSTIDIFGFENIRLVYNYDVLVRDGPRLNQITVKLENPTISDPAREPSAEDRKAILDPFIVNFDSDGNVTSFMTEEDIAKIPLEQKALVTKSLGSFKPELKKQLEGLPAGDVLWLTENNCKSQNYLSTTAAQKILHTKLDLANCTAPEEGGLEGFAMAFVQKGQTEDELSYDKVSGKFNGLKKVVNTTIAGMTIKFNVQLKLVKYREITSEIYTRLGKTNLIEDREVKVPNTLFV